MNSGADAGLPADTRRERPFVLESDRHRLPGREDAAGRGEHVEVRAVVGPVGLAVARPGELLPVRAAGQQHLPERLLHVVDQLVGPAGVVARPLGEEVEMQLDAAETRGPRVAIGRQVLAPVVLLLLLGRAALASPADVEGQPCARDERGRGPRVPAAIAVPARARGRSRWMIRVASGSRRRYHLTARQAKKMASPIAEQPAEHHGRAVELQHAHVAGRDRLPHRPVPDPVEPGRCAADIP